MLVCRSDGADRPRCLTSTGSEPELIGADDDGLKRILRSPAVYAQLATSKGGSQQQRGTVRGCVDCGFATVVGAQRSIPR